jgi:hypothetical protein
MKYGRHAVESPGFDGVSTEIHRDRTVLTAAVNDPDGSSWAVQEIKARADKPLVERSGRSKPQQSASRLDGAATVEITPSTADTIVPLRGPSAPVVSTTLSKCCP